MRYLPERQERTLIPSERIADDVRIYRINGKTPTTWPHHVAGPDGVVKVFADGRVQFSPNEASAILPARESDQGSFEYSLWTDDGESAIYQASVTGYGATGGIQRGWHKAWDSRLTQADYYVDGQIGHDTNAGTTPDRPLRSVQAAVDLVDPDGGDTVLLRGGNYRGMVNFDRLKGANKVTILSRYGNEVPVVSGADDLRGWVPVDAQDAASLGLPVGKVFQLRVPEAQIDLSRAESLGIVEDGAIITLATDQIGPTDPILFGDTAYFHDADEFIIADERIIEIRHPDVLGQYQADQLRDVIGVIWSSDNRLKRFAVGAVSETQGNAIRPADPPKAYISEKKKYWRYALRNIVAKLAQGTWAYRRHHSGDVIVYLWPNDPANLTDHITYAARTSGWNIGTGSGLHIQGISFADFGGSGPRDGAALGTFTTAARRERNRHISIHNCHFARCHNPAANYGAIYISNAQDVTITATTVRDCQNAGVMFATVDNLSVTGCLFKRISFSGLRCFDTHGVIFAFSDLIDVARAAHANTSHFYGIRKSGRGVDRVLMYGLRVSGANGYITWQNATRVDMGFCDIAAPIANDRLRSVVDQNHSRKSIAVAPGQVSLLWNNLLRHNPDIPDGRLGALTLGTEGFDVSYAIVNNIIGGGGVGEAYLGKTADAPAIEVSRRANIYTRLMWWQGERAGWRLAPDEAYLTQTTGVLRMPDFTLPPGSALPNFPIFEMTTVIRDILISRHPGFDFGVDIDGNPFDWATASVGPYQKDWNLQIRTP